MLTNTCVNELIIESFIIWLKHDGKKYTILTTCETLKNLVIIKIVCPYQ